MIKDVTSENFQSEVLDRNGVVLVDVWADWCGPCKRMNPILNSVSDEFGDKLLVAKVDADSNPELVEELKVQGIPTMILYVNGSLVKRIVGAQPRSVIQMAVAEHVITQF